VKHTALDAVDCGFKTYLIEDACRGVDLQPGDVRRTIEETRERKVIVTEVAAVPGEPLNFCKENVMFGLTTIRRDQLAAAWNLSPERKGSGRRILQIAADSA
jgi:hypothetical protein